MEEQRLAACAEKLKRLNEKHRQADEGKSAPAQTTNDEAGAAYEEASSSAPAPVSSPVPSIPVSQSQAPIVQAPLPERMEREGERVEPSVEEEVHLPRQPSPPVQRPVTVGPDPQSEGESSLVEVSPLMEENQVDRTTVPIRDYFNIEDNRGELAQSLFSQLHVNDHCMIATDCLLSFVDANTIGFVFLQWMSPTCLCLTWTPPVVRKSLWHHHSWKEKQQLLCVPLSPQAIPNSFKSLCLLVSSDSR